MAEIGDWTLMLAVQAVDREIRRQRRWIDDNESEPEDLQTLEDWLGAARDLEQAYDAASRRVLNLPAYEELVGG